MKEKDEYVIYQKDRELDIKKHLLILWKGKWIIIFMVSIFSLTASYFSFTKIDVYKSEAKVLVNKSTSYGFEINNRYENVYGNKIIEFISKRSDIEEEDIAAVNFSIDRNGIATISQVSVDKESAFINVSAFVNNYNEALKLSELIPLELSIESTRKLLIEQDNELMNEFLANRLSHQLYKKEILEDSRSELAKVIKQAKPAYLIQSKKAFKVLLSSLLGFGLGCMIVIARFSFINIRQS